MDNLISKIESLLFISGRPMSSREISELLKIENREAEEACEKLLSLKKECSAGTQVIKNGNSFQMVTSPDNAAVIQEFVKDETTGELSRPSLETLTIIAYRGPVSKTDLDRIRGVNCGLILHNLLMRGLIDAREDKKKEESYYTVTFDFLKFLGLNDIKELPDYERLSADDAIDRILADNSVKNIEESSNAGLVQDSGAVSSETKEEKLTDSMTEDQKVAVFTEALEEVVADSDEKSLEEKDEEDELEDEAGGGQEEKEPDQNNN